jgi:hypothetical protein
MLGPIPPPLRRNGPRAIRPQPVAALSGIVDQHTLIRSGSPPVQADQVRMERRPSSNRAIGHRQAWLMETVVRSSPPSWQPCANRSGALSRKRFLTTTPTGSTMTSKHRTYREAGDRIRSMLKIRTLGSFESRWGTDRLPLPPTMKSQSFRCQFPFCDICVTIEVASVSACIDPKQYRPDPFNLATLPYCLTVTERSVSCLGRRFV